MCLSLPVLRIASLAMICPSVNGSVSENRRGKRSGGFGKVVAKCRVCFVSGAAGILSYRILYLDRFIMLESLLLRGSSVGHGDYGGSLLYVIKSGATTRGLSKGKPRLRDICIHPWVFMMMRGFGPSHFGAACSRHAASHCIGFPFTVLAEVCA